MHFVEFFPYLQKRCFKGVEKIYVELTWRSGRDRWLCPQA
jgi:hypothetical protein